MMLTFGSARRSRVFAIAVLAIAGCSGGTLVDDRGSTSSSCVGPSCPPCSAGEVLSGNMCVAACAAGLALCDGKTCVDVASDPANCGACGVQCAPGQSCAAGACVCPDGQTLCGDGCTDTTTDHDNCLACGIACNPYQVCNPIVGCGGASTWLTLGSDEQHSGYNASETNGYPVDLAWSVQVDTDPLNPVVVADDHVFVTPDHALTNKPAAIHAFGATDGEPLWTHDLGEILDISQPTVHLGKLYVEQIPLDAHATLLQLDASTGAVDWTAQIQSQGVRYWAPLVTDDAVYVNGGLYGGLLGFSRQTGKQFFFNDQLEQYDAWSPALFGGLLYTFVAGKLRAHDPQTGAIQSTVETPWNWNGWSMNTAPVFGMYLAYVISPPTLYAIDPAKGTIVWKEDGGFEGMPAFQNGDLFALNGGSLSVWQGLTHSWLWSFDGDKQLTYPPVITASGYVYVASKEHVYAVDPATKDVVWTDSPGGWLSIAAGKLFVARVDGTLAAYDLAH